MSNDEPGRALATALVDLLIARFPLLEREARTVLAIAGECGSGKTVTAAAVAHVLGERGHPVIVLHQDDYFHRPPATNHAHREADLTSVGPQEVDLALLASHVAAFRQGQHITGPRVDYPANRFVERDLDFTRLGLLVVEGTYVVGHIDSDIRVFLEATSDDSRERRLARNRDVEAPFLEQVLATEHGIVSAQSALADVLVDRHFHIIRPPD